MVIWKHCLRNALIPVLTLWGVFVGNLITGAIVTEGLTTLESVRAVTKASASCGSCTPLVEQLLKLTLGDGFQVQTGPKPACKCTRHDHGEVRRRIVAVADAFSALTSRRPWREAVPVSIAVEQIEKESGFGFEPKIVGAFRDALPVLLDIRAEVPDLMAAG